MNDLISRQAALDALEKGLPSEPLKSKYTEGITVGFGLAITWIEQLPSVQPEVCEGCKHLGKWENEVEYGYPSPCTRCKRRVGDHYER